MVMYVTCAYFFAILAQTRFYSSNLESGTKSITIAWWIASDSFNMKLYTQVNSLNRLILSRWLLKFWSGEWSGDTWLFKDKPFAATEFLFCICSWNGWWKLLTTKSSSINKMIQRTIFILWVRVWSRSPKRKKMDKSASNFVETYSLKEMNFRLQQILFLISK